MCFATENRHVHIIYYCSVWRRQEKMIKEIRIISQAYKPMVFDLDLEQEPFCLCYNYCSQP